MGLVDSTLGATFIGFNISCVIFGILTTQVYVYFQRFPLDKLAYKLLVAALWCLELLDQIFIAYSVYFYVITNFANPFAILRGKIIWTLIIQIVLGNFVGTIVKCCFSMRVWRFSKRNLYITGAIVIMILVQFALAILYCVKAFQLTSLVGVSNLRLVASLALSAGPMTDILIALALCYFLRRLRTGHKKADSLVRSLSVYAINTGALTAAVSSLTLILYNVRPNAFYFMASYFTLAKLYAISFLAALNTRKVVRGKGTDQESGNTSEARNTFFLVTNNGRVPRNVEHTNQTKSVEIDIHQEVSVVRDIEDEPLQSPKTTSDSKMIGIAR
ncbi:hypothetical protein CPB84DRAFT_318120 [Gymnopilus junonius]|uniref:DUF6534 domain-containing protein n=1 Tax=Gymnopilus junonius TaxID=109634 RepID=A0A9P5NDW2_GYMJU|nr:hypothetical protein CPB84DRAFT_318120 [Gymnopilus junonius]